MSARVDLPGMRTPGAGFDQPFDMLDACHDRVRRSLDLLQRLRAHLRAQGRDDDARQAARDVLRYFDIAAPLHHQDEELHIFPPLLAQSAHEPLADLVRQMQREHLRMAECWARARQPLEQLAQGALCAFAPAHEAALEDFARCYDGHLRHEDEAIYPAARAVLSARQQQAMGHEMAARRGARAA
jgi:hemerythrin-like domain-containing protein